ncbi:hypothetical protein [Antarcticirhabdus aurantiaca]|uniref:Uncharacterized protein n=1 Tax=Antarcticirhabdus aurantiaca TaxID=2606717 RepID=A0ACD4NQ09_9HYPH|nr:hypothetical protein [Antarcticirhabdus aurantiaca]WAJ28928.1 hypothetical protein OXU80_01345 [Jeongeuplla avenae]
MSYRSFSPPKIDWGAATVATTATLSELAARTVANVATVARGKPAAPLETVADVATVARVFGENENASDLEMEAEERAAILQYDAGLPRMEAERLAFGRLPTPGITVRAPAVELPAAEYDMHLDTLIMAAGAGTPEGSRLAYAKRKGWVVPRGDETVFTRGR